jgi:hypothetical protein
MGAMSSYTELEHTLLRSHKHIMLYLLCCLLLYTYTMFYIYLSRSILLFAFMLRSLYECKLRFCASFAFFISCG